MAVTVPLEDPHATITRVVAYGVRAALDPVAGAAHLDRLVRSHRFTDGAEFVARARRPTTPTRRRRRGAGAPHLVRPSSPRRSRSPPAPTER